MFISFLQCRLLTLNGLIISQKKQSERMFPLQPLTFSHEVKSAQQTFLSVVFVTRNRRISNREGGTGEPIDVHRSTFLCHGVRELRLCFNPRTYGGVRWQHTARFAHSKHSRILTSALSERKGADFIITLGSHTNLFWRIPPLFVSRL